MRILLWLPLWLGLLAANLPAGTVLFQVSDLGAPAYRYTYFPSDFAFQANQELDIRFDHALYSALSNGTAGAGFNLLLLQPNNPLGGSGDYSALAEVNNPSLTGSFSVDFIYNGPGQPGAQPFFINQFDPAGNLVSTIGAGVTTPAGQPANGVPEPASFSLAAVALLAGGARWALRRRASSRICGAGPRPAAVSHAAHFSI